jgi:hypothetical protein
MRRKYFQSPNVSQTKELKCFSFTTHSAKITGSPVCSNFVPDSRKTGLCVPTLFLTSESQACGFHLCSWLQKVRLVCYNFVSDFRKSGLCNPTLFLAPENQACMFHFRPVSPHPHNQYPRSLRTFRLHVM